MSDSSISIRLSVLGRMPLGREDVRLQWQVAPLGVPFGSPSGVISGTTTAWTDVLTTGQTISQTVAGLEADTPYHWRVRLLYRPGNALGLPASRWLHSATRGWNETGLRTGPNQAPVLASIGDQSVAEGNLLAFTFSAMDENQAATWLTYSLSGPAGAAVDPASGAFSWTPSEAQGPGTYTMTITVTDDGSPALADSQAFRVSVSEVNVAPVLASIGDKTVSQGETLTFTATASDSDLPANALVFSLDDGAPAGASINPTTGVFTWTPGDAQAPGTYTLTVTVTDGGSPALGDFETLQIVVSPGVVPRQDTMLYLPVVRRQVIKR